MPKKSLAAILLAAILGGGIPVFSKIALGEIPPLSFTFLRFLIASILILPFFIKEKDSLNRKSLLKVVSVSLLATLNVTLFSFGIRLTSTTVAQTLYSSVPVFAAILSYLLLKQKLGTEKIFGILIGLAGVVVIILPPALIANTELQSNFLGNSIIFIAMISFSLYTVISKKLQHLASPLVITSVFMFTTTLSQLIPATFETGYHPNWWTNVSLPSLLSIIYVSIIGTVFYYFLYQYAIKHANPLTASLTFYLQPVATYLWATILLTERIEQSFLIGAGFIFIGTWLVIKANKPTIVVNTQK